MSSPGASSWFFSSNFHRQTRSPTKAASIIDWQKIPNWIQTYQQLKARKSSSEEEEEEESSSSSESEVEDEDLKKAIELSKQTAPPAESTSTDQDMKSPTASALPRKNKATNHAADDENADSPRAADESGVGEEMEDVEESTSEAKEEEEEEESEDEDDDSDQPIEVRAARRFHYAVSPELNAKIKLYQGDITKLNCDAIVNAANNGLWGGGGICGAIFSAAGDWKLEAACKRIVRASGKCPTGQTRLTRGYALPAKYIMHTVGPMDGDENDLISAYQSALQEAAHPVLLDAKENEQIRIRSFALCCISTGIFGFDNDYAAVLALKTVRDWLEAHPVEAKQFDGIVFCTFLKKDQTVYEKLLPIFFPVEETTPPTATPASSTANTTAASTSTATTPTSSSQKSSSTSRRTSASSRPRARTDHSEDDEDIAMSTSPNPALSHPPSRKVASSDSTHQRDANSTARSTQQSQPRLVAPLANPIPSAAAASTSAFVKSGSQAKPSSGSVPPSSLSHLQSPPLLKKRKSEEEERKSNEDHHPYASKHVQSLQHEVIEIDDAENDQLPQQQQPKKQKVESKKKTIFP